MASVDPTIEKNFDNPPRQHIKKTAVLRLGVGSVTLEESGSEEVVLHSVRLDSLPTPAASWQNVDMEWHTNTHQGKCVHALTTVFRQPSFALKNPTLN